MSHPRTRMSPFADAPARPSYTRKHRPIAWESMLGTLCAWRHGDEEAKYFDYDYEAAHEHAGTLTDHEDLRVCRVKHQYAGWPRAGKWALFGVRVVPQDELREKLEYAEWLCVEAPGPCSEQWRRAAIRNLADRQLKDLAR